MQRISSNTQHLKQIIMKNIQGGTRDQSLSGDSYHKQSMDRLVRKQLAFKSPSFETNSHV